MKLQAEQAELAEAARWVGRHLPNKAADPTALAVLLTAGEDGLTVAYSSYDVSASVNVDANVVTPGRAAVGGKVFSDILSALPSLQVDITGDDNGIDIVAGLNEFHLQPLDAHSYPSLPPMPPVSGSTAGDLFATAVANVATGYNDTLLALPELGGIRIQPDGDGHLKFVATDRYRAPVQRIPWTAAGDATPVLLPGKALVDIAKTAGGVAEVELALTAGSVGIRTGGRTSVSRQLPVDKHPKVEDLFPKQFAGDLTCDSEELADAIRRISLLLEGPQSIELSMSPDCLTVQALRNEKATGKARLACQLDGLDAFHIAFNPRYLLDALQPITGPIAFGLTSPIKPVLMNAATDEPTYQCLLMPIRDPAGKAASG